MSLPFKPHIDRIVHAAVAPAMTATPIKVVHIHTPIAPLAVVSTQPIAPAAVPARLAEAAPQATRATQELPEAAVAADPPRPAAKTVTLAPDEIAMLVKRGKDLLTTGDVASARLLLRRAAEAGDAEGALAFGSTFDPAVIARLGAIGVEADTARARKWYEKAAALGSNLASDKIAKLAEAGR
jgi:TPR repeat protein